MEALFLKLLDMSISASWLVLFVIAVRLLLKKAPRAMLCLLWLVVGIRLICPISIESPLSLVPDTDPVIQGVIFSDETQLENIPDTIVLPSEPYGTVAPNEQTSPPAPTLPDQQEEAFSVKKAACAVWMAGAVGMMIYMLLSGLLLRRKTSVYVTDENGIRICDDIDTPFILGALRPKIYVPSDMPPEKRKYVIAHERAHIKRGDHMWKPIGFLLLSLHWFNPLMWIAYILLCKDIEIACDEKVISKRGEDYKKEYSSTLLSCSTPRKIISACPLAFGEVGVKERIKKVMNYKKPTLWITLTALLLIITGVVCFLTDRSAEGENGPESGEAIGDFERVRVTGSSSTLSGLSIRVTEVSRGQGDIKITVEWENKSGYDIEYGEPFFMSEYDAEGNAVPLENDVAFLLPAYRIKSGGTVEKTYNISLYPVEMGKKYRFETSFYYIGRTKDGKGTLSVDLYIKTNEDMNTDVLPPENIKKAENYRFLKKRSTSEEYEYISLHPDGRATLLLNYHTSLSCTYEKKENELVLYGNSYFNYESVFTFTLEGENYVFNAEKSSNPPYVSDSPFMSAAFYAFTDGSVFEKCGGLENLPFTNSVKGDLDGNGVEDSIYYNSQSVNNWWGYLSYCVIEGDFIKGCYFIQTGDLVKSFSMYSDESGKIYARLTNKEDESTVLDVSAPADSEYKGIKLTLNGYDASGYLTDTCYAIAFGKDYTVIYSSDDWPVTIIDRVYDRQMLVVKDLSSGSDEFSIFICTDGEINASAVYKASDLSGIRIDIINFKNNEFYITDKEGKEQAYEIIEKEGEIILMQNGVPAPETLN